MDCSQDLLELDSEINRINILKDSDPFLLVLPSPEISEEPLADGLNTPPVTPLHSPPCIFKEERWLFSLPPVVSTLSTHSEEKLPSNTLAKTESGQNSTPHVTVREKKSKASRRRAAHPISLPLPSEEYPPRKRIRSNTVAAHLDCSAQDTSKPPTFTGNDHSGKTSVHPISKTGHFTSWTRTNYLAPTFLVANNLTPNSRSGETTHHLTNAIHEPSSLPDTQEVVGILQSKLFRIVMFI